MQSIEGVTFESNLYFDHGVSWLTLAWRDSNGIPYSLAIDTDLFCSREMPIRSGTGLESFSVESDRVRVRFTKMLAAKLELEIEVEFIGAIDEATHRDFVRFADEYF